MTFPLPTETTMQPPAPRSHDAEPTRPRALVAVAPAAMRTAIADALGAHATVEASDPAARDTAWCADLVVLDLAADPAAAARWLRDARGRGVPVIGVADSGDPVGSTARGLRGGAHTVVAPGCDAGALVAALHDALALAAPIAGSDLGMVGQSPAIRAVRAAVRRAGPARDVPVLIQGESGTGKELVAKAIHQLSNRRNRPFVALNCAALPEQLVEDELFGHVKGAFTGAERDRDGRFKQAHNGTLFIDEIGEMAPSTQAKLLRVLETFEFSPVGATNTVKVDVRVLAATNRDLEAEVRDGNFREDLFYRIHVVRIDLPPLRERTGDIALLVRAFLDELGPANGRPIVSITPEAMQCLEAHEWPGNVRELRNTLEQVIVLSQHEEIRVEDLPDNLRRHKPGPASAGDELIVAPGTPLRDLERAQILRTMDAYDGNRARVADVLGISLRTLQRKLKEYGLTRGDG